MVVLALVLLLARGDMREGHVHVHQHRYRRQKEWNSLFIEVATRALILGVLALG
jgi:hypothetical protein